jgi:hypothetical protein
MCFSLSRVILGRTPEQVGLKCSKHQPYQLQNTWDNQAKYNEGPEKAQPLPDADKSNKNTRDDK